MSEETIAKRYARALFEIAKESRKEQQFEHDLKTVLGVIHNSVDVAKFLSHPGIDTAIKKQQVKQALQGQVSEEVLSLTLLLLERRRVSVLPALVKEFTVLANEAQNAADATVYSAIPLTVNEVDKIAAQFGKKIGKTVKVRTEIDPSVIGGLIIRIGDRLYDGSIKGQLDRFKQSLVNS